MKTFITLVLAGALFALSMIVPSPGSAQDDYWVNHWGWYDNVYQPIAELIREYGILEHFPGRTEADLYLWITARWLELSRAGKAAGPAEAVADILFEAEGAPAPPPLQEQLRRWLGRPRRVIDLPARLARRATKS